MMTRGRRGRRPPLTAPDQFRPSSLTRANAAWSSPEYQSRVSMTSATAIPRSTVNWWTTAWGVASSSGRKFGSAAMPGAGCNTGATPCFRGIPRGATTRAGSNERKRVQHSPQIRDAVGNASLCRAGGDATPAGAAIEIGATRELALALRAAGVAQLGVMRAAGPGGGFLGVAGAAVPNTFSKRHGRSFRWVYGHDRCWRETGCKRYAARSARHGARLRRETRRARYFLALSGWKFFRRRLAP